MKGRGSASFGHRFWRIGSQGRSGKIAIGITALAIRATLYPRQGLADRFSLAAPVPNGRATLPQRHAPDHSSLVLPVPL